MTINVNPLNGIYISIYTRINADCQLMYPYSSGQFKNILPIPVNSYGLPDDDRTAGILKTITCNPVDKLLVFDKSDGPIDNEMEYISWAEKLVPGREFIVVTSNYYYHFNKHPKIVHYPRYFFTLLNDKNLVNTPNIVDLRLHKISCLSRNPWIHKTLNLIAMRKQPWFDHVQKSFGWIYPELEHQYEYLSTDVMNLITQDDANYLRSVYPLKLQMDDNLDKFESNACPTYQNCYIDYAPESRHDQTFISEKTWKPIFSGQFFFILGPCGVIEYLRDIGVDVFDDLIDHGYDNEPDLVAKIGMLMASITKFLENDLDQVWANTLDRRRKNLELVYSPDFQQRMSADLFSRVS